MFSSLARLAVCAALVLAADGRLPAQSAEAVSADPLLPPRLACSPAPVVEAPWSPLTDFKLSQTYLPKFGGRGFGNHDTDFSAQVAVPGWEPLGKPLLFRGGFGVHAWDGPARDGAGGNPQMPAAVYDLYFDLGWKPRPAEWLFLDLGVTTGLYSDFRAFPNQAFRLRGRGLAVLALSEQFQFVAGVLYVNRNATKVIPAGGFVWTPNDATKVQMVFPQPKIARRIGAGDSGCWLYVAGEFGGGTWAYRRPDGTNNSLDLNDYRVLLGCELRRADGWNARAEVGYVFGRELVPLNAARVSPADTVAVRLSLNF